MPGRRGPTLRSQWLGGLLREARAEGGKTLRDAAGHLAVDVSTMSRYESGRIPAQLRHVGALLDLYRISEVRRRDAMIELSREAWRHDWWDAYETDVPQPVIDHAWLEDQATVIRFFDTLTLTPGPHAGVRRSRAPRRPPRHRAPHRACRGVPDGTPAHLP